MLDDASHHLPTDPWERTETMLLTLGNLELAIDRDGFRVFCGRRHYGWNRRAGFWGKLRA